ncbi:MAG: SMP-30/gluconolactonase/LRE family protein [Acidimicrobiales bacterium]
MIAVASPLEVAQRATAELGEGPTWDAATGRLVWVDILGSEVHHFDPVTGADDVVATPQHVGAAKPRAGGGLALNLRDGVALTDAAGTIERWLARWPRDGCRGNDAAVDAAGCLWAGTMRYDTSPGGGRLYRVDPGGQVVTVLDEVTISNGIGWSPDGGRMYYVDTPTRTVDVFDVHPSDPPGTVRGRRPLVELGADTAGDPDGLTVDTDGCVWVALWDGSAVHRYTPDGRLDRVVSVPTARPTACTFGGPGLHDLYVTTGRDGLDDATLAREPLAGSVLVLPDAGSGLPTHPFAG